jgi:CRP/FNR family transcriptional regulator
MSRKISTGRKIFMSRKIFAAALASLALAAWAGTTPVARPTEPQPLTALVDAVRDREEAIACLARSPAHERVRAKLLQLARSHGKVTEAGIVVDLPLKHELLAEMVGSTRETVTWALQELAREGFATRVGRVYRLDVAPAELAAR